MRGLYLLFFTCVWCTCTYGVASASPSKPQKVRVFYDAALEQVTVRWNRDSRATAYKIIVQSLDGERIASYRARGIRKKFSHSGLMSGTEYRVRVQAISASSKLKSRFSNKRYIHELSRKPGKGRLRSENSVGRTGSYYLPPKFNKKNSPLLVGFHGQGGKGISIVNAFAKFAKKHGFIIVAPSSRFAPGGIAAWEIGTEPGDAFTEDYFHTQECMQEVLELDGVEIDTTRILAIGYSAGGAVAPYIATHLEEFTHFAVLHGGTWPDGFGAKVLPGWYSTGTLDTLRTPNELEGYVATLGNLGFNDSTFTSYQNGHSLTEKERREVIQWWLSP